MAGKLPGRAIDNTAAVTVSSLTLGNSVVNSTIITLGNSTVNTVINSTSISTTTLSGNGSLVTSVNAIALQGNTVANILASANTAANTLASAAYSNAIAYSGNAAQAYTNATSYASNADNISSGTLNTARFPATVNVSTAVNVGANVTTNTTTFFVGNSTVNTNITGGAITISGVNISTAITSNAATAYSNATSYADTKAATAYSNAITYSGNAVQAYNNAVAYAASNSYVNSTFLPLAGGTLTGALTINATANVVSNLSANNVTFRGNVQIDGNLTVSGTTVTLNVASLNVTDNMIYLNKDSTTAHPDLGFAGNYNDGSYKHAGFFRDATDAAWKVFDSYTPEPDASAFIDTSNNTFRIANFTANVITGNSFVGNGASVTSVDAATVGGNTASTLRTYSDTVAATAYSNGTSYADTKAATAYSNATSYADTKAATAYSNAISYSGNAALAYSNAVSYADTKAATAYSNATSYADTKAATAYSNAISYSGNAALAYANATTYASNASNISSGTLAFARLPSAYIGTTAIQSSSAAQALSGISSFADGGGSFLFKSGSGAGTTRHINLANSTSDPATVVSDLGGVGITWGERTDNNPYYLIYMGRENYASTGDYTKLTLAWHTGIKIGAASSYGGTRFYNNSPFTGTEIFSVGRGDSHVRVVNNLYAPIMYDSDDTGYYLDARSSSILSGLRLKGTDNNASGGDYILWVEKPNNNDWGIGVTGQLEYNILYDGSSSHSYGVRGLKAGAEYWRVGTDYLYHDTQIRAPIFYDSNDTGYYINGDSVSNLNAITATRIGVNPSGDSTNGFGISLYGGYNSGQPTYGLMFQGTGTFGTFGSVYADWATYFTMNNTAGRGWIFRNTSDGNVAGINNAGQMTLASHLEIGNNLGYPNIQWNSGGSSSGMVIFYLPGTTSNYGMVHMVFDIYEYNSPRICTVIVGGHNWGTTWYNTGCNVVGYTDKSVRLGVKDGRFCVVFGTSGSSWSYGTIVLRKIHNGGFYNDNMNMTGDWSTTQTATESFTNVTSDLRGLRTPSTLEVDGIGYSYSSFRAPIFYDYDNTSYYVDPAGTPALNINGGITFATANPYITASSYFVAPGGAYFNGGTVYCEAAIQARGGVHNDAAAALTLTGGTGGYTVINGSTRSPIFYDSDNTSYYVDPSSTTTSVSIAGIIAPRTTTQSGGTSISASPYKNYDLIDISSVSSNFTITADSGGGILNGQKLMIRIAATGSISITVGGGGSYPWNQVVTVPTSMTSGQTLYVGATFNSGTSKWDIIAARLG